MNETEIPATKADIFELRRLIESKFPGVPVATAATLPPSYGGDTTRLRGDAAAAKYCGYATRRAFLAFAARHRVFPIVEARIKFWRLLDLDRAKRPKSENPAVWRPGRIGGGR